MICPKFWQLSDSFIIIVVVPGSTRNKPKANIFDAIRKPPSVAMEKIQSSTAATLDRMAVLQQRYRQHKEAMNSDSSDKSRRTSTTSTIDSAVSQSPFCSGICYMFFFVSHYLLLTDPHFPLNLLIITLVLKCCAHASLFSRVL